MEENVGSGHERGGSNIDLQIESRRIESIPSDCENLCLFCGKECDKKEKNKRNRKRIIIRVTVKSTDVFLSKLADADSPEVNRMKKLFRDAPKGKGQGARYHQDCQLKFLRLSVRRRKGRYSNVGAKFDELFEFMRNAGEEQFSFDELIEKVGGSTKNHVALTRALLREFGEEVVITKFGHRSPRLVTFTNAQANIFNKHYELRQ